MKKILIIMLLTLKNFLFVICTAALAVLAAFCASAPIVFIGSILSTIGFSAMVFPAVLGICAAIGILIFCFAIAKDEYKHKHKDK